MSGSSTRARQNRHRSMGTGRRCVSTRWTHFDADGTRLIISGSQKTGPNTSLPVVELWDLAGPKRLMSTADAAPELALAPERLLFHPSQKAFTTLHDPTQNKEGIVAILWETATGKMIGRYKGYQADLSQEGDYLEVKDKSSSSLVSLKTHEVRTFPGRRFRMDFGVPGRRTAVTSPEVQRPGGESLFDLTLTDLETGRTRAVLADQWALTGGLHAGRQAACDALEAGPELALRLGGRDRKARPVHPTA